MVHEDHFVHGARVVVLRVPEHLLAEFVGDGFDALGPQVLKDALSHILEHVLPSFDGHVVNLEVELQKFIRSHPLVECVLHPVRLNPFIFNFEDHK